MYFYTVEPYLSRTKAIWDAYRIDSVFSVFNEKKIPLCLDINLRFAYRRCVYFCDIPTRGLFFVSSKRAG